MRVLILIAALLGTSSATTEVVVPRNAIKGIELGTDFECRGPDIHHLMCKGINLTIDESQTFVHVKGETK